MNHSTLTLGQAAKQVGCSKGTLSKALNSGELSAEKREDGSYSIQPAELMRWNETRSHINTRNQLQTPEKTGENASRETSEPLQLLAELAELKGKLATVEEASERERRVLADQVADLKARLDAESDERRRMTERLLAAPEKAEERPSGLFGWLTPGSAKTPPERS